MEINRDAPQDSQAKSNQGNSAQADARKVAESVVDDRMSPERIVQQHYAKIYAYCYRLCGDRNQADDLCQQTFVTAFRSLAQLKHTHAAGGWLATTARRLFWQQLKTNSKQQAIDENLTELAAQTFSIDLERGDWVEVALRKISPMARMILVMYYFENKTYQEIAVELEVPLGTVMSRLARGKSLLKNALLQSAEPITISTHSLLQESIR
ncbi:MAG: polymerase sigma factor SigE [Planctomycetota bacterium]|jgi:RNA polymerase sigma-70 factor (ECF subfamily)